MKSKRVAKAAVADPEPKTKGTIWAEENRARCNKLTDAQREKLLARALEIIYGRKAAVRRR
jgi:hypothetical protein